MSNTYITLHYWHYQRHEDTTKSINGTIKKALMKALLKAFLTLMINESTKESITGTTESITND